MKTRLGALASLTFAAFLLTPPAGLSAAELKVASDHPGLRIMTVPRRAIRAPQEVFPQGQRDGDDARTGRWCVAKSKDRGISAFSALGYYLGVQLREKNRG